MVATTRRTARRLTLYGGRLRVYIVGDWVATAGRSNVIRIQRLLARDEPVAEPDGPLPAA